MASFISVKCNLNIISYVFMLHIHEKGLSTVMLMALQIYTYKGICNQKKEQLHTQ